jgi:glycosyl transferase family 25
MDTIQHAFYINLLSRPDRNIHALEQLASVGIQATRFNAVSMVNGAIGCSMSHLKLLELAKKNNWDHILIAEDDILFTNPTLFTSQFDAFLSTHNSYDVVLLAGNNIPPYIPVDNTCVKVTHCQTTTAYLVKNHYYDRLIQNYKEGILRLIKEPAKHNLYAIDKYWFRLQEVDTWFLIIPLTVTQQEGYSNIEKRYTNYSRAMLDIDKSSFFTKS